MKLTGYNSVRSWAIAVACSLVMFLAHVPILISGILFVAFLDRYDTDRKTVALSLTISGVLRCLTGPFIGYLGGVYELRSIVLVGSFCASLGMGVCFFAEDMITVTVSLGLLYGSGQSLANCILPQILKQHFTKNIANANGVMYAGSSVGTFAIVPVVVMLVDRYGVSGALLLTAGIMLHAVPTAMILKAPTKNKQIELLTAKKQLGTDQNSALRISEEQGVENDKLGKEIFSNSSNVYNIMKSQKSSPELIINKCIELENIANSLQKDSITNIEEVPNNAWRERPNVQRSNMFEEQNKYRRALKTLTIFGNPSFLVIMLCHCVFGFAYVFVSTIIIDYSRDKGIPKSQEQFFIMLLSVAQFVGHTCLGWIIDKRFLSAANFLAVASVGVGVSCLVLILSNNFYTMLPGVLVFGMFVAASYNTFPALVYECIEEEKHTMAIASRMILFAPLIFTFSPMIGYFRGTLGSYDGALYLIIASTVLCAVLLLFMPCITRFANRKQ